MNFKFLKLVAVFGVALGLIACSDSDEVSELTTFDLRFIHASADAPPVNIEVDGETFTNNLDFKSSAGRSRILNAGPRSVEVLAQVPGGTATVIGPVDLTFESDVEYTVIALGEAAAGSPNPLDALILSNTRAAIAPGFLRAEVVHAAPNAPEVDVYVTAPTDDLLPMDPLGTFMFGGSLGPVDVPEGDYRIRVVVTGDATKEPVFDSGTVSLSGGDDLKIVAVENTNVGAGDPDQSPISLVVSQRTGALEIVDTRTQAAYRAAHFSPNTDPVNILINDAVALGNVPYPVVSDFSEAPAGTYNVKIELAANPGAYAVDQDLTLEAGKRYSAYAAGYTNDLIADGLYVLEDDFRSFATGAKVRVVHLAAGAPAVDIYVTEVGAGIVGATPAVTDFEFKDETGYVQLAEGQYDVTVTLAGTDTIAIGPATIDVVAGGVYTALARDAAGGGAPFGLEVLVEN
jgi:hypothetical protein